MSRVFSFFLVFSALQTNGQSTQAVQFQDTLTSLSVRPSEFVVFTYRYKSDTIYYWGRPYRVEPPTSALKANSAFGFIQFEDHGNTGVPSHALFMITNYDSNAPWLYVDKNFNLDLNDDGPPYEFSLRSAPVISLSHSDEQRVQVKLKLKHIVFKDPDQEKTVESFANEGNPKSIKNELLPARFWLTEARQNFKLSSPLENKQRVALMDWDNNGRFNDAPYDKIIIVEQNESFRWHEVSSYEIGKDSILHFNDKNYRVAWIDSLGDHINLKAFATEGNVAKRSRLVNGKAIPDFKFTLFNGKETTWNRIKPKDKYILIDFWGTWCKPCLSQTTTLKELKKQSSGKLEILGLAYEQNRDRARAYAYEQQLDWLQGFASEELVNSFNILNFPYYILVDQNGNLVGHNVRLEDVRHLIK